MALRTFKRRDENATRVAGGKNYCDKPVIRPRAALGTIGNVIQQREALHKDTKKPTTAALKPAFPISKRDVGSKVGAAHYPAAITEKSPEVEDMEIVTSQLSTKLCIEDIDATDCDNPQLCAEYVKEIYEYMMMLERKFHIPPTYMATQPEINSKMRTILIDWLIQVHQRFNLLQETLYLTISIIDRYLTEETVDKAKLQLVGVTAMLIASKYEEMYAPEVRDFVFITDDTYSSGEIKAMECHMLQVLDYSFGSPLCLHFLRRYSRAGEATPEVHTMGKFLMELCLPDYQMLAFTPSLRAAAALYLSKLVHKSGGWTPTLDHYTTYTEAEVLPCVYKIAKLVQNMPTAKQQAVRTKYASSKFMRVSKHSRLFGEEMKNLASKSSSQTSHS